MLMKRLFPFEAAPKTTKNIAVSATGLSIKKALNTKVRGLDFNGAFYPYSQQRKDRANFEEAPYDLDKIIQAIDTDSYIKQGFFKYKELFWKEGWDIVSENPDAAAYLWQRIDFFEEVMETPFNQFLQKVADNLVKFANVFIVEVRKDISPIFPGKLYPEENKETICGYYIIPTETVRIHRNKYNKVLYYKQCLEDESVYSNNEDDYPTWTADEVIHLAWDKKDGRAFGTPFLISVLDDVVALRQIEEDVQNLIHRDLFPLYKYIIGTKDEPSSPEEIEEAAAELANLRTEGGIILPERHDVDVIGGKDSALEVGDYLMQFKERVAVGMGLSPHHLGMLSSANRSVTDRLDIALYDKIKLFQAYLEDEIRVKIFNRLLREGGFDPTTTPFKDGPSDRCYMRFREIDIDTQIKKETHSLQLFAGSAITLEELRLAIGENPEVDVSHLLMTMTAQLQAAQQIQLAQVNAQLTPTTTKTSKTATGGSSTSTTKPPAVNLPAKLAKPDAVQPSAGGAPNQKNDKGVKNKVRPANQFGRRSSPNVRHFDDDVLNDIIELLEEKDNTNE